MTIFVGRKEGVCFVGADTSRLANSQHLRHTRENTEMINANELASSHFFTLRLVLLWAQRRESDARLRTYALIFYRHPHLMPAGSSHWYTGGGLWRE